MPSLITWPCGHDRHLKIGYIRLATKISARAKTISPN
jgi:hypothetical protein